MQEHNLAIERDILEKAAKPGPNRSAIDQKIGDFYAACMDEAAIDAKGVEPIEPVLEQIDAISSKQDLANEIARLHAIRRARSVHFGVRPDAKNANVQIANAGQGGLGLPDRDYYLKDDPQVRRAAQAI